MSTVPFGRVFGIELRLHVSWIIILALIIVAATVQVGNVEPTATPTTEWFIGIVVATAFLVSSILHELAHALAGRSRGVPVDEITVSFLGGAASTDLETSSPRDEIAVAVAGPLTSIALGIGCEIVAVAIASLGPASVDGASAVAAVIGAMILVIGVVNLLPAFPLDGGRIARAIGWARSGSANEGLRFAAKTGRGVGIAMAIASVVVVVMFEAVDGLMLALCGWLLVSSARRVYAGAGLDHLLDGLHVGDVMDRTVSPVGPSLTLDTFADRILDGTAAMALPVATGGGELLGLIGARDIRRLRRDRWPTTRAADVMVTPPRLRVVGPEMSVRAALEGIVRGRLDGLPVVEDGHIAGVVTRRSVADAIHQRAEKEGMEGW